MDVEAEDWEQLQKLAANRDKWRAKVNKLKTEARRKTKPENKKDSARGAMNSKAITRFTFFPKNSKAKNKKTANKKPNKKISNAKARKRHYDKTNKKTDDHAAKIRFFEPQQQPIQKTTKKMPMRMPKWKEAARTVFSSSDEEESSLPDVDITEADFIPEHRRSSFLYYRTPKKQTNPNDAAATDDDEWSTPLPQHLLPSSSPIPLPTPPPPIITTPKKQTDSIWTEPIPEHLMPTPSPQQQRPTRNLKNDSTSDKYNRNRRNSNHNSNHNNLNEHNLNEHSLNEHNNFNETNFHENTLNISLTLSPIPMTSPKMIHTKLPTTKNLIPDETTQL